MLAGRGACRQLRGTGPPASLVRLVLRLLLALAAAGVLLPPDTGSAAENKAVVVVDTGSHMYVRVVTFSAASISGLEALRLAGANPETVGYGGLGAAVCKLFGVGNPPEPSSCLGTPSDPRYWAYFRAPAGSSSFTYSSVGAGSSVVRAGDVEGWKFGTGEPPPFKSFCEVAGCPESDSPSSPGDGTLSGSSAGPQFGGDQASAGESERASAEAGTGGGLQAGGDPISQEGQPATGGVAQEGNEASQPEDGSPTAGPGHFEAGDQGVYQVGAAGAESGSGPSGKGWTGPASLAMFVVTVAAVAIAARAARKRRSALESGSAE